MSDDELLEALLAGDLARDDAEVVRRLDANPALRAELEALQGVVAALERDAHETQATLAEPAPMPRAGQTAQTGPGGRWLWLVAGLAAAGLLVKLFVGGGPEEPDFPGRGQMLGGDGLDVVIEQAWNGERLDFTLKGGPEEVSSLVEFLVADGPTLEFHFAGTTWTATSEQAARIPEDSTWRLTVYDSTGSVIATYAAPADF